MRTLELLAPAKNLECGIAAIDHGADAVYIGASRFGARAAAGNSIDDIATLCHYAHQFGAKVYVTVNTIIFDHELEATFRLINELQEVGVDALLVQDMALIQGVKEVREVKEVKDNALLASTEQPDDHPEMSKSMALHASTQTDNRSAEKVRWLRSLGFSRVVLARELSLEEIREIHRQVPDVELEVFVHGALCVSYSGQCYMSQHCERRSANRGECAQMCRMKYDLIDADGRELMHQRHLLSLRDMCRIDALEELADAGAVSFKIEGRLKDVPYVKNVVAAYSQRLDQLCTKRPKDYTRASRGRVTYYFKPDLRKTFNRGFTDYFLHAYHDENGVLQGRQADIVSFDTPKALGEYVGKVKELRRDSLTVAGTAAFANGDGLCFFLDHSLVGFRVNRAEGNRLYPLRMPEGLRPGMALYRNNDVAFERLMASRTAERKIPVTMMFKVTAEGVELTVNDAANGSLLSTAKLALPLQIAQKPQREIIVRQLTKLGNTPYSCENVTFEGNSEQYFIPSSQLAELRRMAVEACQEASNHHDETPKTSPVAGTDHTFSLPKEGLWTRHPYLLNVANHLAREFYRQQGIDAGNAFELSSAIPASGKGQVESPLLMQCRYCLRYSLGYCVKHGGKKPIWREPLTIRLGDGREFRLEFDCKNCQMNIYTS